MVKAGYSAKPGTIPIGFNFSSITSYSDSEEKEESSSTIDIGEWSYRGAVKRI